MRSFVFEKPSLASLQSLSVTENLPENLYASTSKPDALNHHRPVGKLARSAAAVKPLLVKPASHNTGSFYSLPL
jgi:hypothetical protein